MPSTRPFWFPDIKAFLAIVITMAMIAFVFVLVFNPTTMDDKMLTMAAGGLVVNFATIMGFYFGSSTGSKDKDDTIGRIAAGQSAPVADKPAGAA